MSWFKRVACLTLWGALCMGSAGGASLPKGEPIKVGATVSLEGRYREPSRMIQASFRMWEAEVNGRGGLLGRPVRLILYDDRSDPERAKALYTKLVDEDKVDLVFSPYGTPLTLAATEVTEKRKLVMLACAASGEAVWNRGYQYVFGAYALGKRYFIGLLDLMAQRGYESVALVGDATSSFNADVLRGAENWARRFGLKVACNLRYQNGKKELPEVVEQVRKAGVDGLILSAYPPDCYTLMEILRKKKYRPAALGMTIAPTDPEFAEKVGEGAEGVFGPSQWEPDERIPFPGTEKFIRAFRERTGEVPSYHAGSAYACCQLYEQAVRYLQSLDNTRIRHYIAALDTVTVIGRFKVDPTGRQVGHNPIMIQWQKGKKEIVWPAKMQTAKPVLEQRGARR